MQAGCLELWLLRTSGWERRRSPVWVSRVQQNNERLLFRWKGQVTNEWWSEIVRHWPSTGATSTLKVEVAYSSKMPVSAYSLHGVPFCYSELVVLTRVFKSALISFWYMALYLECGNNCWRFQATITAATVALWIHGGPAST
jgi:hypothetical protein